MARRAYVSFFGATINGPWLKFILAKARARDTSVLLVVNKPDKHGMNMWKRIWSMLNFSIELSYVRFP